MPRVRALRDFISVVHGNVSTGDKFNMDGKRFEAMKAAGYVEEVQPDPVFTEGATHAPAPGAQLPEAEEGVGGLPEPHDPEADGQQNSSENGEKTADQMASGIPAPQPRRRGGRQAQNKG
jgi:hypothetical protein